ncbi:hypothetical protein Cni_G29012 [Canna indica]|uniref:Uncharacterized protein n=1 Tax=Canna indica TaxID=4628 RepID=A0AAQ3L3V0_9LILI|nr:hypothetical protein Cni_G29012 [Canna indica]
MVGDGIVLLLFERALALAPVVDQGLSWFTIKFKFESEGKAFAAIAEAKNSLVLHSEDCLNFFYFSFIQVAQNILLGFSFFKKNVSNNIQ